MLASDVETEYQENLKKHMRNFEHCLSGFYETFLGT